MRLSKRLRELEREREELREKYLRALAASDNARKLGAAEAEARSFEVERDLVAELLEVVDNLERALSFADGAADDPLVEGVKMTLRGLEGVLARHGVEVVRAKGERFDHAVHEAVATVSCEDEPDGVVHEELQRGYTMRGKLLRPSRVTINKREKNERMEDSVS